MRLLAVAAVLALPSWSLAHALSAEARLYKDRVEIESYFSDNTPARNARIGVFSPTNEKIAEGQTDDKGHWSFAKPAAGRYRIDVNAGDGHAVLLSLTIPASGDGTQVSDGPSRQEFTSFPFGPLAGGIGAIAIGAIVWMWLRARSARPSI